MVVWYEQFLSVLLQCIFCVDCLCRRVHTFQLPVHSSKECLPPWSCYLTSKMFILKLKWEECCLTVWGESCFTLHWIASSTCILASWMLFFGCMRSVWRVGVMVVMGNSDLERPSVPVRTTLSSLDQSNTVTLALLGTVRFTRKCHWQPEEQW